MKGVHLLSKTLQMCAVLCLLSYVRLCDPMDCSLPAPLSMGVLQARTLEWVATLFPRGYSQPRYRTQVSHIAGRFSPAEPPGKPNNTGVGSLVLSPGDLPDLGIEPESPALQVDSLPAEPPRKLKCVLT